MRENGIELSTIGFLSWVGLAYSLKFLWAPLVDKIDAPLLGRWLGRRRGWMLLAQIVVAVALVGMALVQPGRAADDRRRRARPVAGVRRAGAGGGVRLGDPGHRHRRLAHRERRQRRTAGLLDVDSRRSAIAPRCWSPTALILILAAHVGWSVSYEMMALLMGVGVAAVFMAREPAASVRAAATPHPALFTRAGPVRRDRRAVHRVLPRARQLGAADARGDQPVSPAGFRDGADGQSVLRRPGHRQGNRRRGARLVRAGGDDRRHRRRGPVRACGSASSPRCWSGAVLGPGSNLRSPTSRCTAPTRACSPRRW